MLLKERTGDDRQWPSREGLHSLAGQIKFHPKGEGDPPKGPRQEHATVRFVLDTC